jgi:hypothetical protein
VGPLADGLYTLSVRAGRAVPQSSTVEFDDTPATATWRVDTTPPSTTPTGPDAQTSSRNARFDFGAEDATDVSFTCQLDSEPAAPCSAPRKDYANVGLGTHTFKLVAKDTVNDTAPAREWTRKVVSDNDGDGIHFPRTATTPTPASGRERSRSPRTASTGSKLEIRCAGKGCPFKRKSVAFKSGKANVTKLLKKARLRKRAVIEMRASAPGTMTKIWRLTSRAPKAPVTTTLCLKPAAKKAGSCS